MVCDVQTCEVKYINQDKYNSKRICEGTRYHTKWILTYNLCRQCVIASATSRTQYVENQICQAITILADPSGVPILFVWHEVRRLQYLFVISDDGSPGHGIKLLDKSNTSMKIHTTVSACVQQLTVTHRMDTYLQSMQAMRYCSCSIQNTRRWKSDLSGPSILLRILMTHRSCLFARSSVEFTAGCLDAYDLQYARRRKNVGNFCEACSNS